jgi:pyroglutamyl-peptidase
VDLLVTGFEPFRDFVTNPSWQALLLLRERLPNTVLTAELPVDHVRAHVSLRELLRAHRPRAVLCTGVARGDVFRAELSARRPEELRALGIADEAAADADVLQGNWPWSEIEDALVASGVPFVRSTDAGRYVCESTYWSLLSYQRQQCEPKLAGFLHVPSVSEHNSLQNIAQVVHEVIKAA